MEQKTFDELKNGDTVFCVHSTEDGHEHMTKTNPFGIKEYLFFEGGKGLVGLRVKLNVSEKELQTIHSDVQLPSVQPKAIVHEENSSFYCTSQEAADAELTKLLLERIGKHEDYIRDIRKEYYDLLKDKKT